MAYHHVTRDANWVANDIARRVLEVWTSITVWDRQVPKDAAGNQLQDIYER